MKPTERFMTHIGPRQVRIGDFLLTPHGTAYRVNAIRAESLHHFYGNPFHRYRLRTFRVEPGKVPGPRDAVIHIHGPDKHPHVAERVRVAARHAHGPLRHSTPRYASGRLESVSSCT